MKIRRIEYVQLNEKDLKRIDRARFPHMYNTAMRVRKGKPILVQEKTSKNHPRGEGGALDEDEV